MGDWKSGRDGRRMMGQVLFIILGSNVILWCLPRVSFGTSMEDLDLCFRSWLSEG